MVIVLQMLAIVEGGALLGGVVNLARMDGILWVQDWGNYVEAKAAEVGVDVIPLSVAFSFHEAGEHLFVDARSAEKFGEGYIAKAISLPFEELDERFEALDQILSSELSAIVYCTNRECDDALLLAVELRDMGKSNLLYYVDGFELWEESGCPVEAQ